MRNILFHTATCLTRQTQLLLDRTAQFAIHPCHHLPGTVRNVPDPTSERFRDDAAQQEERSAVVFRGQTMEGPSRLVRSKNKIFQRVITLIGILMYSREYCKDVNMSFLTPEDEFLYFLRKFKTTVLWKWKDRTPQTYCESDIRLIICERIFRVNFEVKIR